MTTILNNVPITAERGCRCGHLERQHDSTGRCLGKRHANACVLCRDTGFEFSGYQPQEPTVVAVDDHGFSASVERHPGYGQIGASRVSGGAFLYGSDFRHQHYITIQIWESELHRSLSGDRGMAGRRLIEVQMSEAQWATFVSSLNMGGGVQCTIDYTMQHGGLPAITAPKDRRTQFSTEMQEHFAVAQQALDDLQELIEASTLSGVKKDALKSKLRTARANIGSNTDFVADQFDEHMEKTVEKAKSEVNAYAQHTLMGTGLMALTGGDNEPLQLTEGEGEHEDSRTDVH